RFEGAWGLALGADPVLRWPLMGIVVLGVVLINGSLAAYPRSAMALFRRTVPEPYGLDRVSRHPFFVGVALLAVAHVLLATRLAGTVFAAGLALVAFVGAWHQDRKLHALRGAPYGRYLATTSTLPFAAIVAGRQRLVASELPWASLLVGLALAAVLRTFHPVLFAHDGAGVVIAVAGGGALATYRSWRRAKRHEGRRATAVAPSPGRASPGASWGP